MLNLPKLIEPLFLAAGWKPSEEYAVGLPAPAAARDFANYIIQEFNGLRVGESGAGTEQAASDVRFYTGLRPDVSQSVLAWQRSVGEVLAFACAHNDHMILFAGPNGCLYVFTDPDDRLYEGGNEFGELMRRLLWGYRLGPEIPKDA